jgi:ribosomal protein S18 acetylase RimI-like enzyme
MAARLEPAPGARRPSLVDLRHLQSQDLEPLLHEEATAWRKLLEWDFDKSADLVRRFVDLRALNGCALLNGRDVFGYAYYVLEEHKGLIGDLYVREAYRGADDEYRLLQGVLEAVIGSPGITRVESQLMMVHTSGWQSIPMPRCLRAFERQFMIAELQRSSLGPPRRRTPAYNRVYFEKWSEHYQEPAAQLITSAYLGHVDSLINDQYLSAAGARRFLFNIVQFPGCGTFFKPASFAAFDRLTGRLCGICLASLVLADCGHITQICVSPGVRGAGVGYELLRLSLDALRAAGCRHTSLTVTCSNHEAIKLYESVGFVNIRNFSAYVWEGF